MTCLGGLAAGQGDTLPGQLKTGHQVGALVIITHSVSPVIGFMTKAPACPVSGLCSLKGPIAGTWYAQVSRVLSRIIQSYKVS